MPDPASLCLVASTGAFLASVAVVARILRRCQQHSQEREQEARRIEETLNPIIDELSEEMGHPIPHIKIEWRD